MLTIVKKNDSYDAITYQLENEDNSTVDLTGASVNFVMGKKNKLITNAKATVTSATSGIVSYQLTPSDTLVSGTFLAEFVVTFANGTTKTYPSNGYITVDVEQNLDTSQNNVVLDMIATKQGDFEAKLDSILKQGTGTQVSAMNEYTWTATSGQTIFVFPTNAKYDPSAKWFQVSVGNVPIANELINRASSSQFSLVVDPSLIIAGMSVRAMWVEPIVPITGGHHATHEINGQDEINIANLRNYQELVATPLAESTSQLKEVWVNIEKFPIQVPEVDDTARLQRAIDSLNPQSNSSYNANYKGFVKLARGVYTLKNIIMKSNVSIIGSGIFNTRINPIGTSGYTFDVSGTTTSTRITNVSLEGFTISPKDRFSSTDYGTRPNVGGINLSYTDRMTIKDVFIHGIAGIGINQVENFDCYMEHVELVYVGTDTNSPAMTMLPGTGDLTNAVHIFGMRIELCPVLLKISGNGTGQPPRQNQFVGCKFEWGSASDRGLPARTSAGIIIENISHINFVGCGFVTGDTNTYPLISVNTTVGDIRGLKFNGCDWVGSVSNYGWAMDVQNGVTAVQINGCSFSGLIKSVTGISPININGAEFYDCQAPIIDISKGSLSNVTIGSAKGADYAVKLNGGVQCFGLTLGTSDPTNTKGLYCKNSTYVIGTKFTNTFLVGVTVDGSGNIIRNVISNTATTPYQFITGDDSNNFIEYDLGSAISPLSATKRNQIKYDGNRLQIHDGTNLNDVLIVKSGTALNRPATGRFIGLTYYDLNLKKSIIFDGTVWRDGNGQMAWTVSKAYALNDKVVTDNNVYQCTVAGTSGTTMPTASSGITTDGTVTWQWLKAII